MSQLNPNSKVSDQYLDAVAALFMDCYAQTIPLPPRDALPDEDKPEMQEKCRKLIKADCRRKMQKKFLKGSGRLLKTVAVLALVLMSSASILFVSVEAVRKPIVDFYTHQEDGHMVINDSPEAIGITGSYQNVPLEPFNPDDPLKTMLPSDFYLDSITGSMDDMLYTANYFNESFTKGISFSIHSPSTNISIDTDDCEVTEVELFENRGIMSVDHQNDCIVLVWKNTKLDKMLMLDAVGFEKDDFLSIALTLDYILSRQ